MYGERVQDVEEDVREAVGLGGSDATDGESTPRDLLVVVGGEKVPWALYERADFNVGVTNQPHSEVAGLAVFLDRLFEGAELDREWENADRRVMPEATGKTVIDAGEGPAGDDNSETGDRG
jgi:tRNA (cytidine56-2'-O)-methyltransferase